MGNSASTPFRQCLEQVCAGRSRCVAYPENPFYKELYVKPYNLNAPIVPAAVIRPETTIEVSRSVTCAAKNGIPVQSRSGGHSFGNHGSGGQDGGLMIDLQNFQDFKWMFGNRAVIGAGITLGHLDELLLERDRAIPHGTCPGVGIGGHATVGGLGPTSRMWGNTLDNVVRGLLVTAEGRIQHITRVTHPDLFWAVQGAASNIGIVTEFTIETYPSPKEIVEYSFRVEFGTGTDIKDMFKNWHYLVNDPKLDRRFSSKFIITPIAAIISSAFYGSRTEFQDTGIPDKLPDFLVSSFKLDNWLGHLANEAEVAALHLTDIPTPFYSKSYGLRYEKKGHDSWINDFFTFIGKPHGSLAPYTFIFNTEGGRVADLKEDATAYAHRDKILMYQSYVVNPLGVSETDKKFLDFAHCIVKRGRPEVRSTYPGYIDRSMNRTTANLAYWGEEGTRRLQRIKDVYDPMDVFRHPQSVQPAIPLLPERNLTRKYAEQDWFEEKAAALLAEVARDARIEPATTDAPPPE